jgi:hypothetical protein
MAKRSLMPGLIFLCIFSFSMAQNQLEHPKKVFVSPAGKIYFNKALPVYFRVSTSPDENAPSYLLGSEASSKYSNPMYFDSDGKNTLRSPSAVDTLTRKVVEPKRDVLFDVYADGIAPISQATVSGSLKYVGNKNAFYGRNTNIDIKSLDEISGVEATYISVNQSPFQVVSKENSRFDEEKEYTVQYYSVDNVGNVENNKSIKFLIDITAPVTSLNILGENKGRVLSSKASVSLSARDTLSGVYRIMYALNDGPEKVYSAPIPLSLLKEGQAKISYYAIDNVGNKEDVKVISTSTGKPEGNDEQSFSFYIDKEAPEVSFSIVGDQYKGKNLYISDRSQFQINASDEKSGVEKVLYAQNKPVPDKSYSEPFSLPGSGIQSVCFAASDYVGNIALAQVQQVFVDKILPKSGISFVGKQFYNRDTLFITGETMLSITTNESGSGVKQINYSIDGKSAQIYSAPMHIIDNGFHTIEYHAVDNVNNAELPRKASFFVDNIAPEIHYNFSVKAIGEKTVRGENYAIYPSNAMLYIAATDNASGGERVEYKINGKLSQTLIPVKGFVTGNYEVEIIALDVLKNRSTLVLRFSIED